MGVLCVYVCVCVRVRDRERAHACVMEEVLSKMVQCGGVQEVQILKVGNLSNPSFQEGNHSVNPFRVTPTGLLCAQPVFTQGMLQVCCTERSLVIEEISFVRHQRHNTELKM